MNVMHSSMKITDEFYSNLNDDEVRERLALLGKDEQVITEDEKLVILFREFIKENRIK